MEDVLPQLDEEMVHPAAIDAAELVMFNLDLAAQPTKHKGLINLADQLRAGYVSQLTNLTRYPYLWNNGYRFFFPGKGPDFGPGNLVIDGLSLIHI